MQPERRVLYCHYRLDFEIRYSIYSSLFRLKEKSVCYGNQAIASDAVVEAHRDKIYREIRRVLKILKFGFGMVSL